MKRRGRHAILLLGVCAFAWDGCLAAMTLNINTNDKTFSLSGSDHGAMNQAWDPPSDVIYGWANWSLNFIGGEGAGSVSYYNRVLFSGGSGPANFSASFADAALISSEGNGGSCTLRLCVNRAGYQTIQGTGVFQSYAGLGSNAMARFESVVGRSLENMTFFFDPILLVDVTPQAPRSSLTVTSSHGEPTPASGEHPIADGTLVTAAAPRAVSAAGVQYLCTGWTGSGSVPPGGETTNVTFTITNASSIVWNWSTNYWVDIETNGAGGVNAADSWVAAGTRLDLAATPTAPWLFTGWSGDLTGDYAASNAALLVDSPKRVTACFSADADADGLSNSNEWAIGSDPRNADTDGDGFDDAFEAGRCLSPTANDADIAAYILQHKEGFGHYARDELGGLGAGPLLIQASNGLIRVRMQMRQSEDLVTWTNVDDAVEWVAPADENKQFYFIQSSGD
jgi:hypothetical protein